MVRSATDRITLKSHKAHKANNVYTDIRGSHMANTGRGLSSRGKVEEAVKYCVNTYLKHSIFVHLLSNDVMVI